MIRAIALTAVILITLTLPSFGKVDQPQQLQRMAQANQIEIEFWQSVKDGKDPAELEAYLEIYPQGLFANLASIRLNKLKQSDPGSRATVVAPAQPQAPSAANALQSTSQASDACPCYTTAEILTVCPRPDSGHTEIYDTGQDGKSLNLKCFATRNYSPGSIRFEAGLTSGGRGPFCARQSVEVQPYGSGGKFPSVSPTVYAACKRALDEAAKKLELQLVMDEFSKKDILTNTYREFIEARSKAKSWADLFPYFSSKSIEKQKAMPAKQQQMVFEFSQLLAAAPGETKVVSEAIDANQSVVVAQYCSKERKRSTHTVWYVVENGGWKIRKEYNNVTAQSCGAPQKANSNTNQNANSCTNEEMEKKDARINELLNTFPEQQRQKLDSETIKTVTAKLGDGFCSKNENYCKCSDEMIKILEAK